MFQSQKKSVKVGKRVNTDHVNEVVRNYKQERWIQNSIRLGKEDSLSVWYSLEELEEFMETCKAHGGDGLRLYFGVYDKEHAPNSLYAGRQTVVLVGTREKETGSGTISKDIYLTTESGSNILAYNVGKICPPFCTFRDDPNAIGITLVDKGDEGLVVA